MQRCGKHILVLCGETSSFLLSRNPSPCSPDPPSQSAHSCALSRSVMSNSATPCTVAPQALLSMGFPRQEYWSGFPFLSPGDLPDPGMELMSPTLAGRFLTTSATWLRNKTVQDKLGPASWANRNSRPWKKAVPFKHIFEGQSPAQWLMWPVGTSRYPNRRVDCIPLKQAQWAEEEWKAISPTPLTPTL